MKREEAKQMVARKARAYHEVFNGPNAETVLKDLNRLFGQTTLKKENGVIDPYASIAAAGCREVLLYIEQMRNYDATP